MTAIEPILQLRDALVTRLNSELTTALGAPVAIESRYVAYMKPEDLESPKWLAVINAESIELQLRGLAPGELTVDVGFQAALPATTQRDASFFDTATLDGWIEKVGKLKQLYRPGGVMRGVRLAGCEFRRYTNAPIYRPDMLIANGIFTSVVSLIYYCENNDDDND